jgi:hypothetical protein
LPPPPGECGEPTPSGDYQFIGNTNHYALNGINLPFEMNNGGVDELVPFPGPLEQDQTFREIGVPHEFYFYPTLDHFALILADEWGHTRDWLNTHARRNETPPEVYYLRFPAADLPQYGHRFDGAYWVDGMVVAGEDPQDPCRPNEPCNTPSNAGYIRAFTGGFGTGNCEVQQNCVTNGTRVYGGPPAPANVNVTLRSYARSNNPTNFIQALIGNLRALTLDMPGAGMDLSKKIDIRFTASGGPLTLTLRGDFPPGVTATFDPNLSPPMDLPVTRTADGIQLEFTLEQGLLTIRP